LLFNGETNLAVNLEGEKDRHSSDVSGPFEELFLKSVTPSIFFSVFLLFNGEEANNLAATLEGEKDRTHLFGELFLLKLKFVVAGLASEEEIDTVDGFLT